VPGWLKEAAQLETTVLLTGNIDRVELWNPKLYQKVVRAAPAEPVQSFVRQVFG
jgi:DNA-binding transcriptional regulator/RsmH inhibitor MraZ